MFRSNPGYEVAFYGTIGACAGVGFAAIAVASASRRTASLDRAVERRVHVPRTRRAGRAARRIAPLGKTYSMVPIALASSAYVLSRRTGGPAIRDRSRTAGAVAIAASAILGAVVEPVFDHLLPQPPMPSGQTRARPIFPSGHTFKPMALAITCAHVISREGLATRPVAFGVALLWPLASAAGKLVARKHWASDVAGGVLAGVAIGCACCAGYEGVRDL